VSAGDLCEPRYREDFGWLKCGLVVLERDPTGPEACPSHGGGGLFVCHSCMDAVGDFFPRAYIARARRMEHQEEDEFGPLPD
jgi:hypothetical protein